MIKQALKIIIILFFIIGVLALLSNVLGFIDINGNGTTTDDGVVKIILDKKNFII